MAQVANVNVHVMDGDSHAVRVMTGGSQIIPVSVGRASSAHDIPGGGDLGQILMKLSDAGYDVGWGSVVHADTTANWNAQPDLIGLAGHFYIYTDYSTSGGDLIPGLKIGDGTTLLSALAFISGGGGSGPGEGGVAPGGNAGDIYMKRSGINYDAEWVAPATSAEQDNTRPITAAAVYTEIGNINALLATI